MMWMLLTVVVASNSYYGNFSYTRFSTESLMLFSRTFWVKCNFKNFSGFTKPLFVSFQTLQLSKKKCNPTDHTVYHKNYCITSLLYTMWILENSNSRTPKYSYRTYVCYRGLSRAGNFKFQSLRLSRVCINLGIHHVIIRHLYCADFKTFRKVVHSTRSTLNAILKTF